MQTEETEDNQISLENQSETHKDPTQNNQSNNDSGFAWTGYRTLFIAFCIIFFGIFLIIVCGLFLFTLLIPQFIDNMIKDIGCYFINLFFLGMPVCH